MDQFLCSSLIESLGAGRLLTANQATVNTINNTVEKILGDPSYRKSAQELSQEINHYDALKNFSTFIELWDQGRLKRRL